MTSSIEHPLSHFSLIPADSVFAFYDVQKRQIILSAKGTVHEITTGIAFYRVPWLGGYRFELKGWVGPILGPGHDRTYEVSTPFDIQWPSINPSGKVTIVTFNHPEGELVQVEADGFNPPPPSDTTDTTAIKPQQLVATGESIFDTIGEPFSIRQGIDELGLGYSIHADFNHEYLKLDAAFIDGKDIVWTFEGLKLGTTEVVVVVANTNPPYTYIKPWRVIIGVREPKPEIKS
jgi:hypothetical protein